MQQATVEGTGEAAESELQSLDEGGRTYSDTVELVQRSGTIRRRGARSLSMEKKTPGTEGWVREQVIHTPRRSPCYRQSLCGGQEPGKSCNYHDEEK